MNIATVQLLSMARSMSNATKAGVLTRLLIEHTKFFDFPMRLKIRYLKLKHNKKDLYRILCSYYTDNTMDSLPLFNSVLEELTSHENNTALLQDFVVALRLQNWIPPSQL